MVVGDSLMRCGAARLTAPKMMLLLQCYSAFLISALFRLLKTPKNFAQYPSHRIFRRMHRALNVGKK
jgi:hypothetical protein